MGILPSDFQAAIGGLLFFSPAASAERIVSPHSGWIGRKLTAMALRHYDRA
jgi:hypothetical protein